MGNLGVVDTQTRDNLYTGTIKKSTDNYYKLADGQEVQRGELLKLSSGKLVAVTAGTDTPFTIADEYCKADGEDATIYYPVRASLLGTEIIVPDGTTISDFKEKMDSTGILVEVQGV